MEIIIKGKRAEGKTLLAAYLHRVLSEGNNVDVPIERGSHENVNLEHQRIAQKKQALPVTGTHIKITVVNTDAI